MAKYERDWDSSIFDEDEIEDAIAEEINANEEVLEEAMDYFIFEWVFRHLDEEAQMAIYEKAREIVLADYFTEVDEDGEDEEEEDD